MREHCLWGFWFICSRRRCVDKLWIFHANRTSMCFDLHLNWGLAPRETDFSPLVKYFYWPFQGGSFCGSFMLFLSCFCYAFVRVCLLMSCGHLLGKSWPLGSRFWCLIVKFVTFPLVSWVRCGDWLYRFSIVNEQSVTVWYMSVTVCDQSVTVCEGSKIVSASSSRWSKAIFKSSELFNKQNAE